MRIFLIDFFEILLAVMFATQPDLKWSLALAISGLSVRTFVIDA